MTQLEKEDLDYWRMLYAKTSGKQTASSSSSGTASPAATASGGSPATGTATTPPSGVTPAGTPVGYTSTGKRIKPTTASVATTAPTSNGKKGDAGIVKRGALKLAGAALGGLVAGPVGAAIGNKIADPEWRKNAYRQGRIRPHTAPAPASNQRDIGLFDKADNYDNSFINEAVSNGLAKLRRKVKESTNR